MDNKKTKQLPNKPDAFVRTDVEEDNIPRTVKGQNLGHNSKKEGLGPNTKR